MAINTISVSAIACLLLCLCISQYVVFADHPNVHRKYLTFEFVKHLQGAKKGDKIEGIHNLKKFLHQFGYLDVDKQHLNNQEVDHGDQLDENMERAIKTYQLNFNLNPTGILDSETLSLMAMPRCGVPDIINGKTRMNSGASNYTTNYKFFDGSPKWPASEKVLTWAIAPGTRKDVIKPISEFATQLWKRETGLEFEFVGEGIAADIKISFASQASGDPRLDGPGKTLAYAYAPTVGVMVFDGDENWADGAVPGKYDLGTVGLHELGHALGLEHSSDEAAVMFPTIPTGVRKGLGQDDVEGIRALYNM
ncbi:hypothetical protein Tsubulata_030930 [Turnera subulata]|uniref:Peptidase metallopeptidase domain-containing protein n=1 Tax=Turnera subulata TaxID=218843 RepID=A0A9Q0GAB2_9ROSI|nr:hypothetical protein Tsubulata_030930 [Turnera subulata]